MNNDDSLVGSLASFIGGVAGRIIVITLMILAVYVAISFSYSFGHAIFYQDPIEEAPGKDIVVEIEEGTGIDGLAEQLKELGLIDNELAFRIQGRLYKTHVWEGSYVLNTSMTTKEMLTQINLSEAEHEDQMMAETAWAEVNEDAIGGGSDGE